MSAERDNDFGFAIPARDLLWIADQLRARGRVDRAYLGVRLEPMERPLRSGSATSHETGQPSEAVTEPPMMEGARLQEVIVGSPAARAGLMAGDLIVALDGQPVRSSHDLTDRLDRLPAQTSIRLEVIRTRGLSTQRINLVMQSIGRPDPGPQLVHSPAPSQSQPEPGEPGSSSSSPVVVVPTASAGLASSSPPGVSAKLVPVPASSAGKPGSTPKPVASVTAKHANVSGQPPVSIPALVRSPLRAPVTPPQAEELSLTLPRAISDRLEQLERRIERIERQGLQAPKAQQASSARTP